jgi:hypothetical protein
MLLLTYKTIGFIVLLHLSAGFGFSISVLHKLAVFQATDFSLCT